MRASAPLSKRAADFLVAMGSHKTSILRWEAILTFLLVSCTDSFSPVVTMAPVSGIRPQSEVKERDEALEGLACLPYLERLSCFVRGSTKHWVTGGVSVLDFRPLFSVTIHHLQRQLAEAIQEIDKTDLTTERLDEIGVTVHKYSTE
jgi:hypothetical protein